MSIPEIQLLQLREAASVGSAGVGVWGRNGNHCRGTQSVCALVVRTRRISRLTGGFPGRLEIAAETRLYLAGWSLRHSSGLPWSTPRKPPELLEPQRELV